MRQYWQFKVHHRFSAGSEEEVLEAFRCKLQYSIAQDTGELKSGQLGLSLSGGLDSPLLAALSLRRPQCFSWEFQPGKNSEERRNIEAVSEYLQLPVHWVSGAGAYPLSGDFVERFVHENSPYCNAFAMLKSRLYEAASQQGCQKMMVGDGGDLLYGPQEYWLRDLFCGGQLGAFFHSASATIGDAWRGDSFSRACLRRLLPIRGIRQMMPGFRRHWMTAEGKTLLSRQAFSPIVPEGFNKYRFDTSIGARWVDFESEERRFFAQCGIGRSNPFWNWPLLQLTLNIPAYLLYRDGVSKLLARKAMKNRLPEQVLGSERVGLLDWFFLRGIEQNRALIQEILFRQPRSDWQRYVSPAWLEPYLAPGMDIALGHTILWRVICYELWTRRLEERG